MTQHSDLTVGRWAEFTRAQQILQISLELKRSLRFLRDDRMPQLKAAYERALRLVDLTVATQADRSLRRELLRWRGIIAELYLRGVPDEKAHRLALRVLLQLDGETSRQIRFIDA